MYSPGQKVEKGEPEVSWKVECGRVGKGEIVESCSGRRYKPCSLRLTLFLTQLAHFDCYPPIGIFVEKLPYVFPAPNPVQSRRPLFH